MNFNIASSAAIHNTAQTWAQKVFTNGGAYPSGNTIRALSDFMGGLDSNDLTSKMISVVCFVPDNLTAAITPLYQISGRNPWLNTNFVAGDLTINGLVGDASSKYLKTGLSASMFPSTSSCGLSLYNSSAATGTQIDFGCSVTTDHMYMAIDYQGVGQIFDCLTNTTPRLSSTNTGYTGFSSGNKTSPTECRVDHAKSTSTYNTFMSQSIATGLATNDEFFMFAINPVQTYSSKRFSFAAVHHGLSFNDGKNFYNLVQDMRQRLGGGYV